jgi:Spy/CpxP family protein refolding chaperone
MQGRMQNLSRQLNLTDAQKEKIRPLVKHEMERIKEVRSNSSLTQGEARRRIRRIRQTTNQQIAEFLTPDQKKQLEEIREERRGAGGPQGGQRGPNGGAPEPPAGPPNPPNSN